MDEKDEQKYVSEALCITYLKDATHIGEFLNSIGEEDVQRSVNDLLKTIMVDNIDGVTIVCEMNYVDRLYRDTYYAYFATKYHNTKRNCKRLFFFSGNLGLDTFFSYDDASENKLQENFVGVSILKPLSQGKIGRTLLDPVKLHIHAYIRTTDFQFFLFGHTLQVEAFPYSSQDGEMMTCAETTAWNIIEYYGVRYPEHKTALPSEMLHLVESMSYERDLPSSGLSVYNISYLLKAFGFSPRICIRKDECNERLGVNEFHRMFHYYVESGFPLAVAVKIPKMTGHAVVCIGHGTCEETDHRDTSFLGENVCPCINSADMYNTYVLMDDNQMPYRIEPFDGFTVYHDKGATISGFIVPLPEKVFLEAMNAEAIARKILQDEKVGIKCLGKEVCSQITNENPLVFRLFLTSARKYRGIRIRGSCTNDIVRKFYGGYPLPKFVWVAEISDWMSYQSGMVVGEIVIDATATGANIEDAIILIRYGNIWMYRSYHDEKRTWCCKQDSNSSCAYPLYVNNLKNC